MDRTRWPAPRRTAFVAGVLFLITFVTSIPAYLLFQPALDDPAGFIAGAGGDAGVLAGVILELILVAANIGTAVVLFPVLRRRGEALSLGFVTARIAESVFIMGGILCMLGLVSLRLDDPAAGSLAVSLAAIKDWTFLLGPGIVVGIGNGLILGVLMYRARLVPRSLALLGIVAGPVLLAAGVAVLAGVIEPGGTVQSLATIPEFAWELSLGILLAVRGFSPRPGVRPLPLRRQAAPAT
ncbi:MAG: DUF4386 domain-containing protein [Thermoleophilia bacterium]|jgi:hypothetical protein|nr:DUF4386 domain-containing protein [Thermoleophilia bacterium]